MIPSLAVVGHPNKGKSSIVATLAENTRIKISANPGTTRGADRYTLSIDGEPLYELVDTPGFQRAGQLHNWLAEHGSDASARPDLVRQFVDEHKDDPKFADECALLTPILAGAGILYVVDGSKPYGPEYELEMDVLRWTGQPRMALINMIGDDDYRESWRAGLGQFFSIVREFDAHQANFSQRIALLSAFAELEESWRQPLAKATRALTLERERQLQQSCDAIGNLLRTALAAKVESPLPDESKQAGAGDAVIAALTNRLHRQVQSAEQRARREVERIYRHQDSDVGAPELDLLNTDLFTEQSWQLFGLSKLQLITTGAASGAIAGGSLDVLLGGTSLLLGTVVGGALGSVTAWLGGPELAKIKILGATLGGDTATVGPIREINFPWVLLGRACLHHALISERNHALRTQVVADLQQSDNFFDFLNAGQRARMEKAFARSRSGSNDAREMLRQSVTEVLTTYQTARHQEAERLT